MADGEIKFSEDELNQILRDKWTNKHRTGYVTIKNCTLPDTYLKYQKEIDDFEVYDSDTWICSFPRTGTTWTSEMVWITANNFDFEGAKTVLNSRFPFIDLNILQDGKDTSGLPESVADALNYAKNLPHPRFIKTHLPFQLLPKQIQSGEKKPKIVYVYRSPFDVCISFYHFSIGNSFTGSLEDFCKLFLSNKINYGNIWDHILGFWRIRNEPNVLFLKYEDMKADLVKVIRETSAFFGRSGSEQEVKNLQNHLAFDSMKNNPSVNRGRAIDFVPQPGSAKPAFIRSGVVGSYKKEMPPHFIKMFRETCKTKFRGTDLSF